MITIAEMAKILGTTEQKVQRLIKLCYLRRVKGATIELPPPAALNWLKLMFKPLPSRPLFTLHEVLHITKMTPKLFRQIVLSWNIPVYYDLFFGELIPPDSLLQILDSLFGLREPVRFDHAALLEWMQGMGSKQRQFRPSLPYHRLIEMELKRIAALPEPERLTNAYKFWRTYKNARLLNSAINQRNFKKGERRREERIEELEVLAKEILEQSTAGEKEADRRKRVRISRRASSPRRRPSPQQSRFERDPQPPPDTARESEPE